MNHGAISREAFRCRQTGRTLLRFISVWLAWMILPALCVNAQTVVEWDFSSGIHGWKGKVCGSNIVGSPLKSGFHKLIM